MKKRNSLFFLLLTYAVVAGSWFFFASDLLFAQINTDTGFGYWLKKGEGFVFIILTVILLYYLIRRHQKLWDEETSANFKEGLLMEEYYDRLNKITSITNDVLWDLDIKTGLVWRNENYKKIFGYPVEGAGADTSANWINYVHEDDRERVKNTLEHTLHTQSSSIESEYKFINSEGKVLNILDRALIFRDEKGNPVRMIGSMLDITALRSSQKSLQASEEHYRKIVETAHEGIWQIDEMGTTEFVNTAVTELLNCTKDDMLGKPMLNFVFEEDIRAAKDKMKLHLKGEKLQFEFRLKKKMGEEIWVLAKGAPLFEGPIYKGSIGMLTDITAIKQARELLQESEEKYRLIFSKNPMPMWVYESNTFCFLAVNDAALEHYGYTRDEFMKLKVTEIRPPSEVARFLKANTIRAQSIRNAGIWKHMKKNGQQIDVEILAESIQYDGKNAKLVLINDITDKLKADRQLQKSYAEIRQLARHLQNIREEERKHVAREIHDELGQQLTAAKMNIVWSEKKLPDDEDAVKLKLRQTMILLDESNNSVRKILNELRTDFISQTSISETLEWQARKFEKLTGITTHTSIEQLNSELDETVSTCLYRTLQETLTNITRYAQADRVEIEFKKNKSNLALHVKDDGIGFEPDAINAQQSFGLLGIQERVRNLNGIFELISSPGSGTTILIEIPLHTPTL
jgi:PAS domain S-box-containing protein